MIIQQTKEKQGEATMRGSSVAGHNESRRGNDWIEALQSSEYRRVEQRIIRQLIESLLYEGIVVRQNAEDETQATSESTKDEEIVLSGVTADGEAVTYLCTGRTKRSFGRIRLSRTGAVRRVGSEGTESEARLADLVQEVLGPVIEPDRLALFMEELGQTLIKDVQAQYAAPLREFSGSERSYDELEGNIMDGHPYHPCYKSRIGFNLEDNASFGPEFKPALYPLWLVVPVDQVALAHSTALDFISFMVTELGAGTAERFVEKLKAAGKSPESYRFVPVHPWQWREITVRLLHSSIAEGEIVLLGEGEDEYRPQQSIRTLANMSHREKAYLKLPMNLINTSTGRMLAKHTVLNAPIISDWLSQLVEQDPVAQQLDFVLLREIAGVVYDHETAPLPALVRPKTYGTLGAIWRESVHLFLREEEEASPFNALSHIERSGTPFIDPWVKAHGVEAWTRQLLNVSVRPLIHLLFAHGVALESHAQNMVLIHRNGVPVRVAFKDFHDGIRFSRRDLANPEACPVLHALSDHHARVNPNSFIETDRADMVRDFVHDAFFFINLTEVCFLLEERYGLPEESFWRMVADIIHEYRREHPQHEARYQAFDLFASTIQVEQLTSRRLLGDTQIRMQEAPNPLHPFR
ncbi:IucA/IucC family protein [Paenibacillus sp. NPDC056579]|uniref:IucA/IucC family protein n=1 Tax=Paenibacillus sp. NPDC056579 TaxID=3345871 RepID=UPI003681CB0A